ncbi:hypothetical protein OAP65_04715 [Litorivicinus sp.]|nr:hypothetical protein [Litorivicinus sp.]
MGDASSPQTELLVMLDKLTVKVKESLSDEEQYTALILGAAELIEHAMQIAREQEGFRSPHQRVLDVINYRDDLIALRSKYTRQWPEVPSHDLLTKFAENELEVESLNDSARDLDTVIDRQIQLLSKFLEKDTVTSYQISREKTQRQAILMLVERVLSVARIILGIETGAINSETGKISGEARVVEYAIKHAIHYQGGIDWLKRIYLEGKPSDRKDCSKILEDLYTDLRARKQK